MTFNRKNILMSIRDWEARDKNDLRLYDILDLRVKDIARRIEEMTMFTARESREREAVNKYIGVCQEKKEDYQKKMRFCKAYGEWDKQQEEERRSENPTSRAKTNHASRTEHDEMRRDIEKNRKQTEENRQQTENNKKEGENNAKWDIFDIFTSNPYLVRDRARDL
jgi:ribosomal silencing factor RsfS